MIRAAVLGSDVGRSRSPAIHAAAFAALGIAGEYRAFSVNARGFRQLVRRLGAEGYRYLNVTIPHKLAAARLVTTRSPLVAATRAANTLVFRGPRAGRIAIRGENTDGYGLLTALDDLGVPVARGATFVLIGAGGAAAGGLAALLAAGAHVRLIARRPEAARALVRTLGPRYRTRIGVSPWTAAALAQALEGADALISAVPAAAWATQDAVAGLASLTRNTAVLEMAYGASTPLAQAARGRVARYQDGIAMLVHQAARAVELALGHMPPTEPMFKAARASS